MRHIVQTAIETSVTDGNGLSRRALTGKATIACQNVKEANEIADGFNSIPGRTAWAGVEIYTEGGIKLVLSHSDVYEVACAAVELDSALGARRPTVVAAE